MKFEKHPIDLFVLDKKGISWRCCACVHIATFDKAMFFDLRIFIRLVVKIYAMVMLVIWQHFGDNQPPVFRYSEVKLFQKDVQTL